MQAIDEFAEIIDVGKNVVVAFDDALVGHAIGKHGERFCG
jgi:hypothetical protein